MLSALNNYKLYDIFDPRIQHFYGIRDHELVLLLKYYDLYSKNNVKEARLWYNGYNVMINNEIKKKYNIWSVL